MITKRIIPCLDVKDGRVVKGVNFQGLSDVNSPVELAEYYTKNGADEMVFYDITASAEGRKLFTEAPAKWWMYRSSLPAVRAALRISSHCSKRFRR